MCFLQFSRKFSSFRKNSPSIFPTQKTFSASGERHLRTVRVAENSEPQSNAIGQQFSYGCVGEITAIDYFAQRENYYRPNYYYGYYKKMAEFTFGMLSFADPAYTTVEERVITRKKEYTFPTQYYTSSLAYIFNGNGSNRIKTVVADVRGITDYNFNASIYPSSFWSEGLISNLQRKDLGQTKVYKTEATELETSAMNSSPDSSLISDKDRLCKLRRPILPFYRS